MQRTNLRYNTLMGLTLNFGAEKNLRHKMLYIKHFLQANMWNLIYINALFMRFFAIFYNKFHPHNDLRREVKPPIFLLDKLHIVNLHRFFQYFHFIYCNRVFLEGFNVLAFLSVTIFCWIKIWSIFCYFSTKNKLQNVGIF